MLYKITTQPVLMTTNHSKFTFWGKLNQDTKHGSEHRLLKLQVPLLDLSNYKTQHFKMNLYCNSHGSKGKVFPVLPPVQQSVL